MTPEQFFSKNMKWIALSLLFLLMLKSVQSCNRQTRLSMSQKENTYIIDSLNIKYSNLLNQFADTTKILNFQLQIEQEKASSADKRASAVQSVAEKLKTNTTINVKGAEVDKNK